MDDIDMRADFHGYIKNDGFLMALMISVTYLIDSLSVASVSHV